MLKRKKSYIIVSLLERIFFLIHLEIVFNIVIACTSLDYFDPKQREIVLKNINSILKPRGLFICIDLHIYDEFQKVLSNGKRKKILTSDLRSLYYFIGEKKNG